MDNTLNTILQNTYTLSQLRHRMSALKTYLEQQFFGADGSKDFMPQIDTSWINSLPPAFLQNFNKDNLASVFEELQRQITLLQTLTIYLTFNPDEQTIQQMGEFTRRTFSPLMMLDIKYNPNLIAGTALVWKGIYKDYSLRSKIEDRKGKILDSFKKFLR